MSAPGAPTHYRGATTRPDHREKAPERNLSRAPHGHVPAVPSHATQKHRAREESSRRHGRQTRRDAPSRPRTAVVRARRCPASPEEEEAASWRDHRTPADAHQKALHAARGPRHGEPLRRWNTQTATRPRRLRTASATPTETTAHPREPQPNRPRCQQRKRPDSPAREQHGRTPAASPTSQQSAEGRQPPAHRPAAPEGRQPFGPRSATPRSSAPPCPGTPEPRGHTPILAQEAQS